MTKNNNTNIPAGYKSSELGVIPEGWQVKRLGEICKTFKSGQSITSQNIADDGLYPVYGGNGLRGFTHSYTHSGSYVLIGRQGALCGNVNYVEGDTYISEHAIAVQTEDNCDLQWLKYKLDFWNLNRFSESSAQPGLSVEKLVRYQLSVPSLEEQERIAEILGTWDRAIELQGQKVALLQSRKRALMQQLLTPNRRLPNFSEPWKKHEYSDVLKEVKRTFQWDDNKLYRLISVRRRSGGLFERESLYGHQIKTKNLRPAQKGDFLISKMQVVHGASGLTTAEFDGMSISGSYIALIAKNNNFIDMNFINWLSRTPRFYHQTYIASYGVHIEKMTFNLDMFMSLSLLLPSLDEQRAIAEVLTTADREIELATQNLTALRSQKRALMQQLLTGKNK